MLRQTHAQTHPHLCMSLRLPGSQLQSLEGLFPGAAAPQNVSSGKNLRPHPLPGKPGFPEAPPQETEP